MEEPTEIDAVYWDESKKRFETQKVKVDKYYGFTECRRCRRPISHNVKTDGQYRVLWVRCLCAQSFSP